MGPFCGTTTVAVRLYDLESGALVATSSFENPQRFGGTDIMARIRYDGEHKGKPFYDPLVDYITSGPVVAMVWQGDDCISLIRRITGSTSPLDAHPGTIRGDFCSHTSHNIIHASDCEESATREIGLFFQPEEIIDWEDTLSCWL